MKGIAESEALLHASSRRGRTESPCSAARRAARPRRKVRSFREMLHFHGGHRSSSSCANRLQQLIGQKEWNPARNAFERITSRCVWKILSGRPSERYAGGHQAGKPTMSQRRWSTVEDVDGRKSPLYGRQFSEHGAMSAALERPGIDCESNRQERRVL